MNSDRERLRRLQEMASLVMDARSQTLRQANAARDQLLFQLAALEAGQPEEGLPWPAPEMARFGYEQWAAGRRAEINLRLATQTAICHQAAGETRTAFGHKQVLEKISATRSRRQLS